MQVNQDRTTILARGAAINLGGKLVGRGVHLGGQVLLARWLGPAAFGLYAIGWNILRLGATLLPLGMENGVIQIGASWWPDFRQRLADLVASAWWATLATTGLFGLALFISAAPIASLFEKPDLAPILRLFGLALPLAGTLKVVASATRISQRMRYGILAEEVVQPLLNLLLIVPLLWAGFGLTGASWAVLISFAGGLLVAFRYIRQLYGKGSGSWDQASALMRSSLAIAAATGFATLMLLTDRILVGYFLSEAETGQYQALSVFAVFFVTVLSAFKTIVAPMISSAHAEGDQTSLADAYQLSTRWGLYLAAPAALVFWAIPEQVIQAVFGAQYAGVGAILVLLTLAQMVNLLTGPVDHMLIMTGYTRVWMAITLTMFILNAGLNVFLIPRWGLAGAAWATVAGFSGTSLLAALAIRGLHGIWPFDSSLAKGLISMAAATGVVWLGLQVPIAGNFVQIVTLALLAYAAFFLSIRLLDLTPADQKLLDLLRSGFTRLGGG